MVEHPLVDKMGLSRKNWQPDMVMLEYFFASKKLYLYRSKLGYRDGRSSFLVIKGPRKWIEKYITLSEFDAQKSFTRTRSGL